MRITRILMVWLQCSFWWLHFSPLRRLPKRRLRRLIRQRLVLYPPGADMTEADLTGEADIMAEADITVVDMEVDITADTMGDTMVLTGITILTTMAMDTIHIMDLGSAMVFPTGDLVVTTPIMDMVMHTRLTDTMADTPETFVRKLNRKTPRCLWTADMLVQRTTLTVGGSDCIWNPAFTGSCSAQPAFAPYVIDLQVIPGQDYNVKYQLQPGQDAMTQQDMLPPENRDNRGDNRYDRGYRDEDRRDCSDDRDDDRDMNQDQPTARRKHTINAVRRNVTDNRITIATVIRYRIRIVPTGAR